MSLLDDLDAFLQEHRRCGFLHSDVARGAVRWRVTLACDCGAVISRTVEAASQSAANKRRDSIRTELVPSESG